MPPCLPRLWIVFFAALIAAPALAQQPPYDRFPAATPPVYRVRYAASSEPSGLIFPVSYTVWIPPNLKQVRGVIVHQHGCGEGSCSSGLTGAYDLHWQTLAATHDCALLAPSYEQPQQADCQMWCDPRNGSAKTFQQALTDLGIRSGHPELATVPWALWGHSGGGHWAGGMTLLFPDRTIATWLRSGVPLFEVNPKRPQIKPHTLVEAALTVPMMCNPGTKEGVTVKTGKFAGTWAANQAFFRAIRGKGGLLGVAVDPLTGHECGNQRYLAIPWLDACLTARLPDRPGQPLKAMPAADAWLAEVAGFAAWPAVAAEADPTTLAWLPNEAIADAWKHYVKDTAVPDNTPPPSPTAVQIEGDQLRWSCRADLESGLACFVIKHNGSIIGHVPETPQNRYGRPLFQNLLYSDTPAQPLAAMVFTIPEPDAPGGYEVIAVNTVGRESPAADLRPAREEKP